MAVELRTKTFGSCEEQADYVCERLRYLVTARPTAVNMTDAAHVLSEMTRGLVTTSESVSTMRDK